MLFQKLFRVLVVSGSMMGLSGCAANAAGSQAPKSSDAGVKTDGGAAAQKPADTGGGASGW